MERKLIRYIRTNCNKKPFGCLVAYNDVDDYVHIGVSICHNKDQFKKTVGYTIALTKGAFYARYKLPKFKIVDEEFMNVEMEVYKFISRCYRYYKGMKVIAPNIRWIDTE